MYGYVCMCRCLWRSEEGISSSRAAVRTSLSYHVVLVTEGRQGVSQFLSYFSSSSLFEGVSLCNPDWPGAHHVGQPGLKLIVICLPQPGLGLKTGVTI